MQTDGYANRAAYARVGEAASVCKLGGKFAAPDSSEPVESIARGESMTGESACELDATWVESGAVDGKVVAVASGDAEPMHSSSTGTDGDARRPFWSSALCDDDDSFPLAMSSS